MVIRVLLKARPERLLCPRTRGSLGTSLYLGTKQLNGNTSTVWCSHQSASGDYISDQSETERDESIYYDFFFNFFNLWWWGPVVGAATRHYRHTSKLCKVVRLRC